MTSKFSNNSNEDHSEENYCICKSSDMDSDMIACDNPNGCKIEWFHQQCVGLTPSTVPDGKWYCTFCEEEMKTDKTKARAMVFICEYCEKEFDDKGECLAHKKEHMQDFSISQRKKGAGKKRRSAPYPPQKQRKNSVSDNQSVASDETEQRNIPSPGSNQRNIPSSEGEGVWNIPPAQEEGSSGSTSDGKLPGPMSPKTGDTPALTDPPASQGAEMGGEPVVQDNERLQLSEETLRHLSQFSDEQILAELAARQEAHVCVCGTVFRDQTLYYLHRSTHNTNNPKKCSQCDYVARDWYDFTSHFFIHRKVAPKAT